MTELSLFKMRLKHFKNFPKKTIPVPSLVRIQIDSYKWFFDKGLRELIEDFSPIFDYSGKRLKLSFLNYYLDKPEHDETYCLRNKLTYEAALRIEAQLDILETGEIKKQEVYFGNMPLVTGRGTFIINGVERAVVSQIIRSPGVYFTSSFKGGQQSFGAEIIPSRGAWIEFISTPEGEIWVKVDKKRKMAATVLLRAFGLESSRDIKKEFSDCDKGSVSFISKTLEEDPTSNKIEAMIEVFKRLRPGELPAEDNARDLFESLFSFSRYDLEKVGRWKINQRLGIKKGSSYKISREDRIVNLRDIIAVIKEIIRLNNTPGSKPDDIDHLANRRIKPVGILLQDRLRSTFYRMERVIRDKMSTLDIATLTPGQLIYANSFTSAVQNFFGSSRLSQFMDQVNPLAELEHKRRISAKGPGGLSQERAGFEVRDVHSSHYGRICPIQTPEGSNIGLVNHIASYARINEFGFLETPYFKVRKGRVTDKIEYLDAYEEQKYVIAHGGEKLDSQGRFINKEVEVRINSEPGTISRDKVDYMDVSPQQTISVSTAMIPFLEHDDANRALMGSNMQRQALPLVQPQVPLVMTGMEKIASRDSGYTIISDVDGKVVSCDASHLVIKPKGRKEKKHYHLINFTRSNQYSCLHQKVRVHRGDIVKKGDVLVDGPATRDGFLSLGVNLLVAFMPWGGFNYEDAIVISERLKREDVLTSIHIEDFSCDVRETKLGPEVTTYDIPNVSEARLANLDSEGIIRIGAEVREGDILVGKISPKGEAELTGEERLLRAVFGEKARDVRDTSLVLPHGKRGRVIGVKIFSRDKGDKLPAGVIKTIQVEVASIKKIQVGDKLSGRHGNKGVIAKILPLEDMPYLSDGRAVDVVLNPLGVASRMNIGQIFEVHLGWAADKNRYFAVSPALAGVTEEEIRQELKKAGLPEDGKVVLYDGRTGKPFDQTVTVGFMYIMKLNHLVEDKVHARSVGPYSLTTQQPLGGKAQFGGQRFGEMEVWALEGYGSAHTLQEMLTIKSDDVAGRARAYEAITKGEKIRKPNLPASFNVLLAELKGLCLDTELLDERLNIVQPRSLAED